MLACGSQNEVFEKLGLSQSVSSLKEVLKDVMKERLLVELPTSNLSKSAHKSQATADCLWTYPLVFEKMQSSMSKSLPLVMVRALR